MSRESSLDSLQRDKRFVNEEERMGRRDMMRYGQDDGRRCSKNGLGQTAWIAVEAMARGRLVGEGRSSLYHKQGTGSCDRARKGHDVLARRHDGEDMMEFHCEVVGDKVVGGLEWEHGREDMKW